MPTDLILCAHSTDAEIGHLAEIADRAPEFIHQSPLNNPLQQFHPAVGLL
jgi:hypothetical protein